MLPDLNKKLQEYVEEFLAADEELYLQAIRNESALEYLSENIPLLDCPDKELELVYYFRWWTFRKHWKRTPDGHIITEFLPPVPWAGPYNSISCPMSHHLREARWLRDEKGWLWEEVRFWLYEIGHTLTFSNWLGDSLEQIFKIRPNPELMKEFLPQLDILFTKREVRHLRPCGLYWQDEEIGDGMEISISGSGIRPTLNSYMCGDAMAIARMAAAAGMSEMAEKYNQRVHELRKNIDKLLWDRDFYRTIPCKRDDPADWIERPEVPPDRRVREEIGFLPWYFHIAPPEHDTALCELLDPKGFAAPYGVTTAEQRHPRFMFRINHECLWNGPVWPYATSQTLVAVANAIRDRQGKTTISKENYYKLLRQYALSHRIEFESGKVQCWIDENMDPYTGRWIARDELWRDHWNPKRGGYERGKDYNHSTFCDLVLDGLLGIGMKDDTITADPIIPDDWDYFMVSGLTQENWTVLYDRDGSHYGQGAGLQCFRE